MNMQTDKIFQAYEGVRGEMVEAAKNHAKIAGNIRELVVNPFGRWCDAHALRIQNSQDDLQAKIKAHDQQATLAKKLRSQYFNKCRLVEDLEEENKLAFKEPEKELSSPKQSPPPKIVLPDEEEDLPIEIGDETWSPERLKEALTMALNEVTIGEYKVPILGTYQNVSSGTDIVDFLQKRLGASSVGYAEKMGQDLVDRGFLRLIGNVGNTFANSSRMKYQWKTRVFQITGIPEKKKPLGRVSSASSDTGSVDSPTVANITETLQSWNPLNNPYPNETPAERLRREAKEADERYKAAIRRLDLLRCNLEESMMDHLKFLERCEGDRLKAIKSVILDFSGAISNSIPSFQSQVDNMVLYQETINPLSDLRYLLENYRTGAFVPRPTPYENYYGSPDDQIFGVDLEARARADRKRVPVLVTSILTYLDNHYPDLEGDDARRSIWLVDVPLAATHHLRNQLNSSAKVPREVLERYEVPIVAAVLKLYLLELPDSLVSSQVYEIIKTIYATTQDATPNPISSDSVDSTPRIKVLQSTLGQLRLNNIATLDAITTHFTRLIDLTSADESYVADLALTLAPCILRPRTENTLTLEDRHAYRLVRDLFDHKEAIFGELKRQSSTLSASNSIGGRTRAVSNSQTNTDESNRRANMEARAKAISEARRDRSPAPTNRHRRDKSTDGSIGAGRFPVVASPRPDQTTHAPRSSLGGAPTKRGSLEVPGSLDSSPVHTHNRLAAITQSSNPSTADSNGTTTSGLGVGITDSPSTTTPDRAGPESAGASSGRGMFGDSMPGSFSGGGPGPHIPPPVEDDSPVSDATPPGSSAGYAEKSVQERAREANAGAFGVNSTSSVGSLKRGAAARQGSGKRKDVASGSGSLRGRTMGTADQQQQQESSQGVTLSDRPFDDDFS
jgi:hypothetical protein